MIKTHASEKGIEYKGKIYPLVFTLNVMEEIQEEYETIDKWGDLTDISKGEINAKALKFGITSMLNEGVDIWNEGHEDKREYFTLKQVGRLIMELGVEDMARKMNEAVIDGAIDETKNA